MKPKLKKKLHHIQQQIEQAQQQSDFSQHVTLLAVSKVHTTEAIEALYQLGQHHFGENYVQELAQKAESLKHYDIVWHFIGAIQSNKTQSIAQYADWVQSVDRLKIAKRLNDQRPKQCPPLNVCIQVNFDKESHKAGVMPEEVRSLMHEIAALPQLKLRGIMCLPEKEKNKELSLQKFGKIRQLYQNLCLDFPELDTLSMGMSQDMTEAILQGSTMVRVGQALFGSRPSHTTHTV